MYLLKLLQTDLSRTLRVFGIVFALAAASGSAQAQHDGHGGHTGHAAPKKAAPKKVAAKKAVKKTAAKKSAHDGHTAATRRRAQSAPLPKASAVQSAPQADHDTHDEHEDMTPAAPAAATVAPLSPATHAAPIDATTEATPQTHTHSHTMPATAAPPVPAAPQFQPATPAAQQTPPAPTAAPAIDHSTHTPPAQPAAVVAPAAAAPVDHGMHTGHDAAMKGGEASDVKEVSEAEINELMVMSGDMMGIRNGGSRGNFTPMGQMGSGTAWQPATSPMYMSHKFYGDWLFMFHGEAKIGVNAQGGPRGVTKFESQNWIMPMAYRRVGAGTLQLRAMLSLEPLTLSGAGSPQLFQTGEVYKGRPIIDAQHPHDLFMELSAQYTVPLGERATWYTYFGFPGEPALGPVAFMHRPSASENPSAPLTHHLQDSTHISFGVLTTGFTYRWFKLEGSVFNGREPDERRYNFERGAFDSRSARLSFAPNANWAFQVSHGFLRNPEQLHEGDVRRTTASVQYNRPFRRGNLAAAFIWGRNHESHDGEIFNLNGYTFETTANFRDRNYLYTRLELVDKSELLTHSEADRLGFEHDTHPQFRVGAYTFGYVRDVWNTDKLSVGLGGDATFYSKPAILDSLYGGSPRSYKFFLRLRPGRMKMDDHAGHGKTTDAKQDAHDAHDKH
jgi:hypothetical protein